MKLLLDTQIYLWVLADSTRLSRRARTRIKAADQVLVSAATIWEAAIKCTLGKLRAEPEALAAEIVNSGFIELPTLPDTPLPYTSCPCTIKTPLIVC